MAVAARKVINRRVRYETELAAQKKEGHPFFPYAMFHDTVVNLIIVLMIVVMAVVWHATAGPVDAHHPEGQNGWLGALYEGKANPAVQVTEPRPEWYFLFLFELLRIFKSPWELIFATIIIPTILMVLLVVWPFLDRGRDRRISRRPVGMAVGLQRAGRAHRAHDRRRCGAGCGVRVEHHRKPGLRLPARSGPDLVAWVCDVPQLRRGRRVRRAGSFAWSSESLEGRHPGPD